VCALLARQHYCTSLLPGGPDSRNGTGRLFLMRCSLLGLLPTETQLERKLRRWTGTIPVSDASVQSPLTGELDPTLATTAPCSRLQRNRSIHVAFQVPRLDCLQTVFSNLHRRTNFPADRINPTKSTLSSLVYK
jgi:hypothetical protein